MYLLFGVSTCVITPFGATGQLIKSVFNNFKEKYEYIIKFSDKGDFYNMDKLRFLSNKDNLFYAKITKENNNVIKLIFDEKPDDNIIVSGFEILNENNNFSMSGDYYYDYNTIYNVIDEYTVLLSNDGSIYIPPSTDDNLNNEIEIELTEEEKAIIEKNNQISSINCKIQELKDKLSQSDYIIVKCQAYLLAGKEIPSEYDIISYNEERDGVRKEINNLELELEALM